MGVRNCRDLTDFGREIRATVLKRTHLTVGVGIAQTKTLAKLANHAAKKWQRQTGGVVDLSNIDRQRRLLALIPVEDVWGVGRRISKLNATGIKTALDLSEQSTDHQETLQCRAGAYRERASRRAMSGA